MRSSHGSGSTTAIALNAPLRRHSSRYGLLSTEASVRQEGKTIRTCPHKRTQLLGSRPMGEIGHCPPKKSLKRTRALHRQNALVVVVVAVFILPQASFAGERAEVSGTVEVVGTTPIPGVGIPIDAVPANVQAASGKSIEEQKPLNLADYLDSNLGSVSVNDTVGNPYQSDVSYRGFTASPLLGTPQGLSVFLDGVRINEPFGDIVNWDLIPPTPSPIST